MTTSFQHLTTSFSAKFDPPSIVKILAGSGCLSVNWILSQQQTWMKNYRLNLEIRLRVADSDEGSEQLVSTISHHYNALCWLEQSKESHLIFGSLVFGLFALGNMLDFPSPGSTSQICEPVLPSQWNWVSGPSTSPVQARPLERVEPQPVWSHLGER